MLRRSYTRRFGRSALFALATLLLVATTSPLSAQLPPIARGTFDAPLDAVWSATIESLKSEGYKIREQHRSKGIIYARRTRMTAADLQRLQSAGVV